MYRYLSLLLVLAFLCNACKQKISDSQLRAINESLINSNNLIEDRNISIYHSLEEAVRDPQTHDRALIWTPKAIAIHRNSANIEVLIDGIKNKLVKQSDSLRSANVTLTDQLLETNGLGYDLFNKLMAFKDTLLTVFNNEQFAGNQYMCVALKRDSAVLMKTVTIIPDYVGTMSKEKAAFLADKWLKERFESSLPLTTMLALNKIENEVLVSENRVIQYCNTFIANDFCGYIRFAPFTILSSSYVKAGQSIHVEAGIGTLSAASKPRFFIYGKEVMLSSDYVVRYDFIAKGKPGKYKVPVKIVFTKADGSLASILRNLEYTIGK